MRSHAGGYFIRLTAIDQPGTMAAIATRMAERDISLESIVQRRSDSKTAKANGEANIILVTHETTELAIKEALENIAKDGKLAGEAQMIRIEKLG